MVEKRGSVNANAEAQEEVSDRKSKISLGQSVDSDRDRTANAKEMPDTFQYKLLHAKGLLLAIGLNIILTVLVLTLASPGGWRVQVIADFIAQQKEGLLFVFCILVFWLTYGGLNSSANAFFGKCYASQHGYSLAAFGFLQGSVWAKLTFSDRLSLRSTCRALLSRLSYIWLIHAASVIVVAFAIQGVTESSLRSDSGALSCLEYSQSGVYADRGWPNLDVEQGVAEYIFGTSLGNMRSEEPVSKTNWVFPPQLVDTCNDGTTISGKGFMTDIFTECKCVSSINDLASSGLVSDGAAAELVSKYDDNKDALTMINRLEGNEFSVNISTILTRTYLCGGLNQTIPPLPVCKTVMDRHRVGKIMSTYMTDGTPASIALKRVDVLEEGDAADHVWLYNAFEAILGGSISHKRLPESYPGAMNPFLWWTTANMQAISGAFLEAGLETMWAMIGKVALQRGYTVKGNTCTKNIVEDSIKVFKIESVVSYDLFLAFIIVQFLIQLVGIVFYSFWFNSKVPIASAVRLLDDPVYLTQMMVASNTASRLLPTNSTVDTREMWQPLDKKLRLGESKKSQEDPEYGMLVLDKPQLVTDCSWGKLYS